MAQLKWDKGLSVDIESFDEQHKKLINYINELLSAMSEGKGSQKIADILDALTDYTRTHFGAEEEAMSTHGYTELGSHRDEHEHFVSRLEEFRAKQEQGGLFLSTEVMMFLQEWLKNHIKGTDKRYSRLLVQKGVK